MRTYQVGGNSKASLEKFSPRTILSLLLVVIAFACATKAKAAIVGVTGGISLIVPPSSVQQNDLTSDTDIFGFDEAQNFTLGSNLFVNGTGAGLHMAGGSVTDFIAGGTTVNSYFFHADPAQRGLTRFLGSVSFDANILGIIFQRFELEVSDSILGNPGTSYSSTFREFEGGPTCGESVTDCATISTDLRTITLDLGITAFLDHIRVVTATVPEPSTLLLLSLSAVGFLGCRHSTTTR